jgi:hypothetical protein
MGFWASLQAFIGSSTPLRGRFQVANYIDNFQPHLSPFTNSQHNGIRCVPQGTQRAGQEGRQQDHQGVHSLVTIAVCCSCASNVNYWLDALELGDGVAVCHLHQPSCVRFICLISLHLYFYRCHAPDSTLLHGPRGTSHQVPCIMLLVTLQKPAKAASSSKGVEFYGKYCLLWNARLCARILA